MPRITSITQRQLTATSLSLLRDTFDIGNGFNSYVNAIAVQSDGKILVGGAFVTFNGVTVNFLTRLNPDGTRDTGFNAASNFNTNVNTIAIQPDGKILVGGAFFTVTSRLMRLNADGTRDTGFDTGTGFDSTVRTIALQSDGKILVGGSFTQYNGLTQNRITRLNADGTRDTGFTIGTGFANTVNAIALQPDGKLVVVGSFLSYDGVTQNRITRLNADGTRDTGFTSGTGFLSTSSPTTIALQPDSKILLGGYFTSYNGTSQNYITRLNADGTRDTGFSIGTGFSNPVEDIAVQLDGKILAGGSFTTYNGVTQNRITRLNADGTRDTGFVTGTGFDTSPVYAIAIQADSKILAGGQFNSYNGVAQNSITRISIPPIATYSQGAGANNINEGSALTVTISTTNVSAGTVLRWRILDRPDDFAVNTGLFTITANSGTFSVTPTDDLLAEGSETFRVQIEKLSGTVVFTTGNLTINDSIRVFDNTIYAIAQQSDSKSLVGGVFTSYGNTRNRLVRFNADGTEDTAFYTNLGTGFNNNVNAIAQQADGKILVGGLFSQFNSVTRGRLVRFNADGTEDTAFNNNLGTGFYYNSYNPGYVQTICIQSDGKILVGGYFQEVNGAFINHLVRLNADGTRDNTFGLNLGYLNSTVMTIAVQSNGLIVIGGFFSYVHDGSSTQGRYGIAWLNSSGEQQSTPYLAIANRVMAYVYAISAQPDGKILVGGSFTTIRWDTPRNRLVRFNADGTEDTAFYTNLGTGFNNIVNAIAQQADGKILVGGQFTTFNGNTRNYLVRLNADGTEDTGFTVGTGFNNNVNAIAQQADGKILVGGQFTQYNGTSQNYIARLTSSGLIS